MTSQIERERQGIFDLKKVEAAAKASPSRGRCCCEGIRSLNSR
jgi:hypothetical protein